MPFHPSNFAPPDEYDTVSADTYEREFVRRLRNSQIQSAAKDYVAKEWNSRLEEITIAKVVAVASDSEGWVVLVTPDAKFRFRPEQAKRVAEGLFRKAEEVSR